MLLSAAGRITSYFKYSKSCWHFWGNCLLFTLIIWRADAEYFRTSFSHAVSRLVNHCIGSIYVKLIRKNIIIKMLECHCQTEASAQFFGVNSLSFSSLSLRWRDVLSDYSHCGSHLFVLFFLSSPFKCWLTDSSCISPSFCTKWMFFVVFLFLFAFSHTSILLYLLSVQVPMRWPPQAPT